MTTAAEGNETYDYIVVGSGAGGGPLSANLARAGYRVLLLEAGSDYESLTYTVPAFHGLAEAERAHALVGGERHRERLELLRGTVQRHAPEVDLPRPEWRARIGRPPDVLCVAEGTHVAAVGLDQAAASAVTRCRIADRARRKLRRADWMKKCPEGKSSRSKAPVVW